MRALATAELFVLAAAGFFALSWAVFTLGARKLLGHVAPWSPAKRHVAIWLLCAAPVIATVVLFAAASSPALMVWAASSSDHCLGHEDGHVHLCFVHLAHHRPHAWLWAAAAVVGAWLAARAARSVRQALRGMRIVSTLIRTGSTSPHEGSVVLDAGSAMCITAGLLRPRVLVSRGLLGLLTPAQQQALFAHEHSHAQRRDALSRLLARFLSRAYPSALRHSLLEQLELAAEQACDEAAAASVGDRLLVADTILTMQRVSNRTPAELEHCAMAMGQVAIERRVHALLDPPTGGGGSRAFLTVALCAAVVLMLGADPLHHLVESLLSPILH